MSEESLRFFVPQNDKTFRMTKLSEWQNPQHDKNVHRETYF